MTPCVVTHGDSARDTGGVCVGCGINPTGAVVTSLDADVRPPKFKGAVCRGAYAFGTACGHCERCAIDPLNPANVGRPAIPAIASPAALMSSLSGRPQPLDRDHIMQFFAAAHLPDRLRTVSEPFGVLAEQMFNTLPRNPERTVALRKLLEAKDAAVRAIVAK